jgi:N12 class adenine-specific DNA methylase/predicted RNA methylase
MGAFDDLIPQAGTASNGARPATAGAFDDLIPVKAAPAAPEAKGWGEWLGDGVEALGDSIAYGAIGAVDRVPQLAGAMVKGAGGYLEGMADAVQGASPYGGATEEELAKDSVFKLASDKVGDWMRSWKPEKDRGQNITMDQLWEAPISRAIPFAIEQGLASLPDMAAAVVALPGYIAGRGQELAETRVQNDGRKPEDVKFGDLMKTLPAAAASAILEKIGAKTVFGLDDAVGGVLARAGKAAVKEAGTEASQESVEYLGEQLGTDKGVSAGELGKRAATAAIAGGLFGGAIGGSVAAAERSAGIERGAEPGAFDDIIPAGAGRAEDVLDDVIPEDRERATSTLLSEDDRASPIPNDLIDDGKRIVSGGQSLRSEQVQNEITFGRDIRAAAEAQVPATGGGLLPAGMDNVGTGPQFDADIQQAAEADGAFVNDIQTAAKTDGQFFSDVRNAVTGAAQGQDVDISEIEQRIREDIEEDQLHQGEGQRPSFLDQFTPAEATAYAQAPGVNRAIARRLGVKIDEMEARGDTERAGRLRSKLGPILESFGAGTAPSTEVAPAAGVDPFTSTVRAPSETGFRPSATAAPSTSTVVAPAETGFTPSEAAAPRSTGLMPSGDGTRRAPVAVATPTDLDGIADRIATPTERQAEAGNYQKGHARWNGLQLAIETPKGGKRSGTDADGSSWEVSMPAHYGDIKGTKGADGDPIDVYVGEDPTSDTVFVVDQKDAETGKFDEHKVFIGTRDEAEVAGIYEGAFSDGRGGSRLQDITETNVAGLKDWIANGDTSKPFGTAPSLKQGALAKKPVTAMLRKAGGVDPRSTLAGELRSMGINPRTAPGLFRAGGIGAADNFVAAEHPLFEFGQDDGNGYIPEAAIMEGLRREMAGDPLRTADEAERVAAAKPIETEEDARIFDRFAGRKRSQVVTNPATEVDRMIDVYGYDDSPELRDLAASYMARGVDPEDAMVAATERLMSEGLEPNEAAAIDDAIGIPFFGEEGETDGEAVGPSVSRAEGDGQGEPGAGRGADEVSADGRRDGTAGEFTASEEIGADGKPQLVIPGTEAVRDRNPAQRAAEKRMQTNKPQAGMDFGMFGTGVDQIDLMDVKPAGRKEAETPAKVSAPAKAADPKATKSVYADKDFRKVFGNPNSINNERYYTHIESGEAGKLAQGWLDGKAGTKLDAREAWPADKPRTGLNARDSYLVGYWGAARGAVRDIRESDAADVVEDLNGKTAPDPKGDHPGLVIKSLRTGKETTIPVAKAAPADDFDAAFDAGQDEADAKADARNKAKLAKSAVEKLAESADDAMAALSALFNSKARPGSGPTFDAETYAQAKPLFISAAKKFVAAGSDAGRLVQQIVVEMREKFGLTREGMEAMRPYLRRFIADVNRGDIELAAATSVASDATDEAPAATAAENPAEPATEGKTDGKSEPMADDGVRPPEGKSADPLQRAEGEGPSGDLARPARGRSAPAKRSGDRERADGSGSVGDRAGTPAADTGTGSGTGSAGDARVEPADAGRPARDAGRGRSDFRITAPEEIGAGGQKTKFDNNLRAIEIIDELGGKLPTEAQKQELARYVGWGGIPQAFKKPDGTYAEGWEARAKKLEATLSKDALAAARRSTQDAHYTSPEIVSAMWRAAQRLGFKSGRVLEPSVGVGNFLGLRPEGVNARFTAVEYDDTTAAIAKALYGASDVHHQGFQDFTAPDGYFDLAIGNPPFGSQKLFDPKREHLNNFSIHNMFFAKSVDLLRPDGVLSMVVSNSFLDAVVKDKARKYIAAKTEFLGAIRLPNNAFSKNAGTEVTTDIIFLRKLKDGEAPKGESWTETGYVKDPLGGEDMPLNEYFVRNPDMMLGTFQRAGSMYRADSVALVAEEGVAIGPKLDAAIAKLPRDVMGDWTNDVVERSRAAQVDKSIKVGSMFVDEKGDVAVRGENFGTTSRVESAGLTGKSLDRAKGLIEIRDALTELRGLQLDPNAADKAIDAARKALNKSYDAFTKANGPISADANRRIFGEDPTWPQLAALEDNFDKGISATVAARTGETARAPTAKKAAIFSKRTQAPYAPPTTAANAKDALTAALSIAGRVDIDLMSRLTNRSEASLFEELSGLLFKTPAGEIVTREEYLSGNVKAKLAEAREAAKSNKALEGNVTALEAVQPLDIEAADIDVKPGAHWMPAKYVADFINHITGAGGATATYSRLTGQWQVRLGQVTQAAQVEYGTDRADVGATMRAAFEQKAVQVYDQIDRDTRVLNQEASEAATAKSRKIADEWRRWIWTDDARRRDLAALYNEQFNTTIPRDFDGLHLTFPGKIGDDILKLRPHQANAVWRMVQGGTTLLDHVVGAGKTFTMVAGAMELRRTGFARKPMFVVPNHLVGQWAEDFMRLYPGARVLAATKKDFEKGNRKRLFARISTGDWDAVIVAHSSFGKVDLPPAFLKQMLDEQLSDIEEAIGEMRKASDGDKDDTRTVKQAEKQREALKERLERLAQSGAKDDSLDFGELGVDALFLDEAHEFKNLAFVTKQRGVMGLGNPLGSQKAMDMFMKTQFILRKNGGRNVVHATGTPISNTMAEMYTVGRYLDYDDMRSRGVVHFDAWARQFGEVVTDWEISPSGKYKLTARFAKFVNMPELMQRYATFADVINREDINRQLAAQGKKLPIPKIKGGKPQNIIVQRSADQAEFIGIPTKDADGNDTENYPQGSLVWRTENMPKKPEKGADNMLKIMGDARKAALDMRLIDPSYGDNPASKINNAANRIRALYDKWDAKKGVQLVFIDLSTPKAAKGKEAARIRALIEAAEGRDAEKADAAQAELDKMSPDEIDALSGDFSVYDDLKQKLIQRGIPEAEIAFIHDAGTELQKDELFGRVRSGRVRVLFGSTAKMGAGMNVQNKLVGLHHMDAPWRPSDLEQREGRIIRQGNELYAEDPEGFEVEINRYATERTLDARMWQTIEAKARFIEQVRKGVGGREIEDVGGEAANAAEMKAAASGNPDILAEMSLKKKVRELEGQRREHMREITRAADSIDRLRKNNESMKQSLPLLRADAEIDTKTFAAQVGKAKFEKMGEAATAIAKEVRKRFELGEEAGRIGSLFGVNLRFDVAGETPYVSVESMVPVEAPLGEDNDPLGMVMKLRNGLNNAASNADGYEAAIASNETQIAQLEARGAPAWPKEAEFTKTREEHEALLAKLRPKAKPAQAAPKVDADAQAEAPLGWGTIEAGEKPRMSAEEQAEVTEVVRRVSGLTEAEFRESIQVPTTHKAFKAWGRDGKEGETVGIGGYYTPGRDAIVVALDANMGSRRIAYHESFHRLQGQFLTDAEKALLANETEALRAIVSKAIGRENQAKTMDQRELEAEGFAVYSERMDAGKPAPFTIKARIRAAWDRLRNMVTRVRNYANGRGYQTLEDVFDRARSGETAARGADGRFARIDPSFSIDEDTDVATMEPQQKTAGFLAKGQPIDRALRAPFDILGLTNAKGEFKLGNAAAAKLGKIISEATFAPDGRMSWMNGPLATARAGLIDRYGLDPAYVERDQDRALDERAIMFQGVQVLKSLADQNVSVAEAKVLQAILTGEDVNDADMAKLAEPIRVAIDELGQEAVQLGLLSAESYERNRGAYLHRVYLKHEADQSGLTKMVGKIMGSNRKKIIGDQFKGRGMFFEVSPNAVSRLAPNKELPAKGSKVTVLDKRAEVDGKDRLVHRVYVPAGQPVPSAYSGYKAQGDWEVRGTKGGKIILWRDYTKDERGKMGEILDARYTIGKTYLMMAHDLATGRFYQDIAANPEWASKEEPIGASWKEASDVKRWAPNGELQWVRVPDTTIGATGGKKRWGALAGQFIRAEIWRDINEVEVMNTPGVWRMLLSQWKLNKTARSPVTHMNNVMSNLMFMDMADVRAQDLYAGIKAYAKGTKDYDEAAENGAFGVDMMAQEIRKNFLQPILDDIAKSEQDGVENSFLARAGFLGRLADNLYRKWEWADGKMIDAYRIEDEVFRMATYMRRREQGDSAKQAARVARETFMDYDIRAPWVNIARNSLLPFASYTYRAVPVIAKSIAARPWKLAKYVTVAYAVNALAYAITGDDEDKERASLRDEEQGYTWLGVPRMAKMPFRNEDGLPVFLDVRRWLPAGDIADTNQGSAAVPVPAPLQFGGPLMLAMEVFAFNKSTFTGEEITNDLTDTAADKAGKVTDYLWKSWMPSAAWVPGSWYFEKIWNAAIGATDGMGRPYDLPSAMASSIGIKLKPQDVESGLGWQMRDMKKVQTALKAEAKQLARQRERGLISQGAFDAGMATYMEKIGRLSEEAREFQRKASGG